MLDGLDVGGESDEKNTAVLILKNETTVTMHNNQNLAFGSILIKSGSQIIRPKIQKGPIYFGKPLYYSDTIDEDNDGIPVSGGELSFIKTGKKRKGKNQPYVGEYDCNDNEKKVFQLITTGTDNDQDGYILQAETTPTCVGDTTTVHGRTYYKDIDNKYTQLADIVGTNDCNDTVYDPTNTCN